jgi:hypothetical protein
MDKPKHDYKYHTSEDKLLTRSSSSSTHNSLGGLQRKLTTYILASMVIQQLFSKGGRGEKKKESPNLSLSPYLGLSNQKTRRF